MATENLSRRQKEKLTPIVPRVKLPGEALPTRINILEGEYTPEKFWPARAGANYHLQYKTKGIEGEAGRM